MVEHDQAARNNAGGNPGDPLIGKVLNGRFRVVEKLGSGGMGTVYKAVQSPLDRLVALKVLNSNYDSKRDPGFQRRFFLEASVTSKLRHPNTITVIDYGKTDDGIYYIAMEYVEGITLAQVLTQDGVLSWNRVLSIGQQIARSLREAHKAGIIHRDLKPANVMICSEESDHDLVKVLDFGLVKSFLPDKAFEGADITQAGVFLGSPQYMAPEQARNMADPRSDIYSLGVVLYQSLIGRPPFYAEQSIDVIVKHMKEPPQPFGAARPDLDIPGEVEALVMKCLAKKPDERYQSMDELLEAIRGAALGSGLSGAFSGSRTPPPMSQSGSGAHGKVVNSGPHARTSGPSTGAHARPNQSGVRPQVSGTHRAGSGSFKSPSGVHSRAGVYRGGVSLPVDIVVDDQAGTDADVAVVAQPRKLVPLLVFLGTVVAVLALVVAFLVLRPAPTHPVVAPPVVDAQPAPPREPGPTQLPAGGELHPRKPAIVHLRVDSEPSGAAVMLGTHNIGRTPLDYEMEADGTGAATATVTLSLDGYIPTTMTTAGPGPELFVSVPLKRKPVAPPPAPVKPPKPVDQKYRPNPY